PKKAPALDYGLRESLRSGMEDAFPCEALPIRARITPMSVFFCPILRPPPPLSVSDPTRPFRIHATSAPNPRMASRRIRTFVIFLLREDCPFSRGMEDMEHCTNRSNQA